jgi:hypothetical protein
MADQAVAGIGGAPGINLGGVHGTGDQVLAKAAGGPQTHHGSGGKRRDRNRGCFSREFHDFFSIILSGFGLSLLFGAVHRLGWTISQRSENESRTSISIAADLGL